MCVGSKGTVLQATIATVLTDIGRVENIQAPNSKQKIFRCLDLDDDYEGVHNAGSLEGGQSSASLYYDPMDDQHEFLVTLVHSTDYSTLTADARKLTWNIAFEQLASTRNWTFIAVAAGFDVTAAAGEPLKADLSLEVERSTVLPV